jgi:hypothetical protein
MSREAARVLAETDRHWDLSGDLPMPRPGWLKCPVCGAADPVIRFWRFHTRPPGATLRRRCDVSVKCSACAAVWPHGLAIDEATWNRRPTAPGVLPRLLSRRSAVEWTIWARDRRRQV